MTMEKYGQNNSLYRIIKAGLCPAFNFVYLLFSKRYVPLDRTAIA